MQTSREGELKDISPLVLRLDFTSAIFDETKHRPAVWDPAAFAAVDIISRSCQGRAMGMPKRAQAMSRNLPVSDSTTI
jgi:hypothetical protein